MLHVRSFSGVTCKMASENIAFAYESRSSIRLLIIVYSVRSYSKCWSWRFDQNKLDFTAEML